MLRNLIITAGRNLVRHKAYALLNVVGLTIGISGCLLVLLFVRLEFSRGNRVSQDGSHLPRDLVDAQQTTMSVGTIVDRTA